MSKTTNGVKYISDNKENKLYTPKTIMEMVRKAKDEASSNNSENNKLIEMEYASALAIALYSSTGTKYYIYPSENPDIHFFEQDSIGKHQFGLSIEIMTLFDYKTRTFNYDYEKLADNIWIKKGKTDYDRTDLLLVSKLNSFFDIEKFIKAMEKYKWNFIRIWLGIYTLEQVWNFFVIIPSKGETSIKITADFNNIYRTYAFAQKYIKN